MHVCRAVSAALFAVAFFALPVRADETLPSALADAVRDGAIDADCVGTSLANEAIGEGLKRGRKLLGSLGINTPRNAKGALPCGDDNASAATESPAAAAAPAATAAPEPAAAPAAGTQRRGGGFLQGLRQPQGQQAGGRRNCGALGAGCADGLKPLVACVNEVTFWGEMANAVEQKRNGGTYSASELADIDADLAAMRAAHAAQASRVQPVDPAKPNRHLDWLTPEEYSVAATAASQKLNAHRQECNRKYSGF